MIEGAETTAETGVMEDVTGVIAETEIIEGTETTAETGVMEEMTEVIAETEMKGSTVSTGKRREDSRRS